MVDQNQDNVKIVVVDDDTVTITIKRHFLIANSTVGETAIDLSKIPVESIEFNLRYGFGATLAVVLVVVGVALSLVYLRLFDFKKLVAEPLIEN